MEALILVLIIVLLYCLANMEGFKSKVYTPGEQRYYQENPFLMQNYDWFKNKKSSTLVPKTITYYYKGQKITRTTYVSPDEANKVDLSVSQELPIQYRSRYDW